MPRKNKNNSISPKNIINSKVSHGNNKKAENKHSGNLILQDMQINMESIFKRLIVDNQDFDAKVTFNELVEYLRNHDRILYSTVSYIVYDLIDQDVEGRYSSNQDRFGTLLSNIEKMIEYVNDLKEEDKAKCDAKKTVWKIWDHVNLARRHYDELRQSDEEYNERFEKKIGDFQSTITKEMNAQLLSMVGIFTALAFVIFGGISSLQSVLEGLRDTHLLKLLILGSGWGLGMLNVTFVFLFCIGKMTKLNFKSTQNKKASFFQKYPVVCWTDFLLGMFITVLSWMHYCTNRGSESFLDNLIKINPTIVSAVGLAVIILINYINRFKSRL